MSSFDVGYTLPPFTGARFVPSSMHRPSSAPESIERPVFPVSEAQPTSLSPGAMFGMTMASTFPSQDSSDSSDTKRPRPLSLPPLVSSPRLPSPLVKEEWQQSGDTERVSRPPSIIAETDLRSYPSETSYTDSILQEIVGEELAYRPELGFEERVRLIKQRRRVGIEIAAESSSTYSGLGSEDWGQVVDSFEGS